MFSNKRRRSILVEGISVATILLAGLMAEAKTIKIAVIDTGLTPAIQTCPDGSYDFITDKPGVGIDTVGHGTAMAKIIKNFAGKKDFCLISYKVFDGMNGNSIYIHRAIEMAIEDHVDIINMSLTGPEYDKGEYFALKKAVAAGIKIFIASGNDKKNLNKVCDTYPACYKGINFVVVGTSDIGTKANYGTVISQKEYFCSEHLCGTSISTAIATGKYINGN